MNKKLLLKRERMQTVLQHVYANENTHYRIPDDSTWQPIKPNESWKTVDVAQSPWLNLDWQ